MILENVAEVLLIIIMLLLIDYLLRELWSDDGRIGRADHSHEYDICDGDCSTCSFCQKTLVFQCPDYDIKAKRNKTL